MSAGEFVHCEMVKCNFNNVVANGTGIQNSICTNLEMLSAHAPNLKCTGDTFSECTFEKSILENSYWADCQFSATVFKGAAISGAEFLESCKGLVLPGVIGK
jgi:uncharacterized protein YjbI with pentapeptide repeats